MLEREDLPAGGQQCGVDCRLTPVGEVPRAVELGLRPSWPSPSLSVTARTGPAAEFEHGAVADQPGYLVQIRQDGWPGWRRVHQVEVRGRVVGAERDVPGLT